MAELKTKRNDRDVHAFLDDLAPQMRHDCKAVVELMERVTGDKAAMWGESIVGFGTHHYQGSSGKSMAWFVTGFSPRKQALTLYLMSGLERHRDLLATLGKHSTGKSCLYVKRLDDVDFSTLEALVTESVQYVRAIALRKEKA